MSNTVIRIVGNTSQRIVVRSGAAPGGSGTAALPSLNGGSGAPQSVTAIGGISLVSLTYVNKVWVSGSGGPVVISKVPSLTPGTADGQELSIYGTSAANTVQIQDQNNLVGSGVSLNGDWIAGKDSALRLHWDATQSVWVENSRQ